MATINGQNQNLSDNNEEIPSHNKRKAVCTNCKKRKIKCDSQKPCFRCKGRNEPCEYLPVNYKNPNDTKMVDLLMKKVDQLQKELQDQKQIADYWRNQTWPQTNIRKHSKPKFSKVTQQFCSNVNSAVTSVSNAFVSVIKAVMPSSTIAYDTSYASLIWNRLLDMTPEDCVENFKSNCSTETATQLLLHCTIFALGIRLYSTTLADLAEHFYNIAMNLIESGWINPTRDDTAEQWILSLMYIMFYKEMAKPFARIIPLWEQASELLLTLPNLDNDTYIEIALTLVVWEPLKCNAEMGWLRRLDQVPPYEPIRPTAKLQMDLLTNEFSRRDLWNYMTILEDLLNRLLDNPYYKFYGVLVYTLKAISAFVGSPDPPAEIAKCAQLVSRFYSEISDKSQQFFLLRAIEHFRYVLSSISITLADGRKVTPMADVLYNMIIQITGAEPDSELEQSLMNMGLGDDEK